MEPQRIRVLDGGMGTTLEALGADVSTALWGCDLLQSSPETIRDVHDRFRDAGADLIQTATYQLTQDGLCKHAKIEAQTAGEIMRSAIPLASSTTSTSSPLSPALRQTAHGVVLSIGPFGATLSPGQEYAGLYPVPYGPGSSTNAFAPHSTYREEAIAALTTFHLDRLLTFSEDPETWALVDWIAFETTPVLTEYTAIRRAMAEMQRRGRAFKPFWISSAFPDGLHPQQLPDGGHASVEEVVKAALVGDYPAMGLGVNCTNPRYIEDLTREYGEVVRRLRGDGEVREGVTFVLYPDGGSVYDVVTRTWSAGLLDSGSWGRRVAEIARKAEEYEDDNARKVWDGVIVGGCCKAGFEEIRALRKALDEK